MTIEFYFETKIGEILVQSNVGGYQDPVVPQQAHKDPKKPPLNSYRKMSYIN